MTDEQPSTVVEPIAVDIDPAGRRGHLVTAAIEVPPRATSNGWGDMSWKR